MSKNAVIANTHLLDEIRQVIMWLFNKVNMFLDDEAQTSENELITRTDDAD